MILVIDNYDSFTFNLVQLIGTVAPALAVEVRRNDRVSVQDVEALQPTHIVISPGPCTPRESGNSNDIIRRFSPHVPILGVCLGHQCIGFVAGAVIRRANKIVHGKSDLIHHDGRTIYRDVRNPFRAARYHSLIIEPGSLPQEYEITARNGDGDIMGVRHRRYPLEGVQFHPESFMTEDGDKLLANFLRQVG